MKQLILLFAGVIIFIIAVGFFTKDLKTSKLGLVAPKDTKEVLVGGVQVAAEIADDESERKKGLSGKTSLAENEGMLFIFPQSSSGVSFWMKDMHFPIDIIWIKDEEIVKIDKNASPEEGVADENLKHYWPEGEINYVLEVVAGFSDKNSVKVGDKVLLTP